MYIRHAPPDACYDMSKVERILQHESEPSRKSFHHKITFLSNWRYFLTCVLRAQSTDSLYQQIFISQVRSSKIIPVLETGRIENFFY